MKKLTVKEIALFGMLGALMYVSKVLMAALPNIHLIAVFITAITVVYRVKALFPIYIYILLEGLFGGFTVWFIPYLYVWTILWGAVMLLPKNLPEKKYGFIVYMIVCGLHGLLYGTLCAITYAPVMGLDWEGTIAWIVSGLPYDAIHGVSNFILASLVIPLIKLLRRLNKTINAELPQDN